MTSGLLWPVHVKWYLSLCLDKGGVGIFFLWVIKKKKNILDRNSDLCPMFRPPSSSWVGFKPLKWKLLRSTTIVLGQNVRMLAFILLAMETRLQTPPLSHLSLSCVRETPRPWNTFSMLMSASGVKRKDALAPSARLFDSFVKFLEEDHDVRAPKESEWLWSTSEAAAVSSNEGDVRLSEQTDSHLIEAWMKKACFFSADSFQTL